MDFYVYIHRRKTDGQIFYVGKGQGKRAWDTISRNRFWYNIVKKHAHTIEIVQKGLQEWYALELERDLIAFYGRRDLSQGSLVNMTDGGDGGSYGAVVSQERKEIARKTHKGKKLSNKTKSKISKALTGRYLGAKNPNAKIVFVTFLTEQTQSFGSVVDAAKFFNMSTSAVKAWIKKRRKMPKHLFIKRIEYGNFLPSTSDDNSGAYTVLTENIEPDGGNNKQGSTRC